MSALDIVPIAITFACVGCSIGIRIGVWARTSRCADAAIKDEPPAWWERAKIMAEAWAKAAQVKETK